MATETSTPIDTTSFTDPIPVPTHGPSGVFAVKSAIHISARPETVSRVVLDPSSYPRWSTFTPCVEIVFQPEAARNAIWPGPNDLHPGTKFTQTVYMTGNGLKPDAKVSESRQNPIEVTFVDRLGEVEGDGREGFRIAWKATAFSNWVMRSERVQELVDDGQGGTQYITWETFGGPLAHIIKWVVGAQLVERFRDTGRDLKAYVEGLQQDGQN
ncbi:MAG: hypothetical protein M1818_002199 [Claussenomyces sp. TS43310]|nr:MAG: hypothetical protein M1818_002199 [Claussenomyces sp. TS43310]